MLDVSNKKLSQNKPFRYSLKSNCPYLVHFYDYKNVRSKYGSLRQLCLHHKNKVLICRTSPFTLPKQVTFSKSKEMLQNKTWFSHKENLKWFSFLPFETPSPLFLPKIGTVLLYSSSFSMVSSCSARGKAKLSSYFCKNKKTHGPTDNCFAMVCRRIDPIFCPFFYLAFKELSLPFFSRIFICLLLCFS